MRFQTVPFITLSIAIAFAFAGLNPVDAQVDRGSSIGPAEFGGDHSAPTSKYTRDGNQVRVRLAPGGGKQINVTEVGRQLEIVIQPNQISVSIRREFGSDELEKLIRRAPELEEALRTFPRQAGEKEVDLSIGLKSTVTASDEAELRRKDVAAFNLYKKYQKATASKMTGRQRGNRGFDRGGVPTNRKNNIGPALPGNDGQKIAEGDEGGPVQRAPGKSKKKKGGGKIF